ncbi:MAG TPA: serpin family protein [Gemmatimonadales bacterium]|nr:serpin family protein [Gemmatimonadales bacterium]
MRAGYRVLLALAVATASCRGGDILANRTTVLDITGLPRSLTGSEQTIVGADNQFAFSVFREIAAQSGPDSNIFISPLSVAMALGMAYNGAAGTTAAEMQQTLALQGLTLADVNGSYQSLIALLGGLDRQVTFKLANSVWYDEAFTPYPAFLSATRTYFDATVQSLDFTSPSASATINNWVTTQTNGKITAIVPDPIPPLTVMYLVNAIYFKGSWTTQFDSTRTKPAPFHLRNGSTTNVPTMAHGQWVAVKYLDDGNVSVIDLPYGGKAFSMTIVLPNTAAGIDSLVPSLTGSRWNTWITGLDSITAEDVTLPKFTVSYESVMNGVLQTLGMPSAFDCGNSSDFTHLANVSIGQLCISEVRHRAFVDVNEQGTEAAAATSVGFIDVCYACGPPLITIDRPFVFVIRERFSGTILFVGRMMNPAAS